MVHHDADLYDLVIRAGPKSVVIHTTTNHLFFDQSVRRWIKAATLRHGDHLRTPGGRAATVIGGHAARDTTGWMWDLTVTTDHDFYIDTIAASVLVHNCPTGPGENPAENPDMGSLNKVSDSQLKQQVGDIHEFKAEYLGRGAQLSRLTSTWISRRAISS